MNGLVSLIGAGPGDPELLSIKAANRIREADVILYDALVSQAIVETFPTGAARLFCGKRCGKHRFSQDEINRRLVVLGKKGKRVVRLKGGDPFVFGRGSEEALFLRKADVNFEVVPGVSCLSAVGAQAGIPVTHRGLSRQVLAMEGHTLRSHPPDWKWLAKFEGTLVIFMGKTNSQWIAQQLLEHGGNPSLPAAMVETNSQNQVLRTMSSLAEVAGQGFPEIGNGPAIIYLGRTISLAGQIVSATPNEVANESAIASVS